MSNKLSTLLDVMFMIQTKKNRFRMSITFLNSKEAASVYCNICPAKQTWQCSSNINMFQLLAGLVHA